MKNRHAFRFSCVELLGLAGCVPADACVTSYYYSYVREGGLHGRGEDKWTVARIGAIRAAATANAQTAEDTIVGDVSRPTSNAFGLRSKDLYADSRL